MCESREDMFESSRDFRPGDFLAGKIELRVDLVQRRKPDITRIAMEMWGQ